MNSQLDINYISRHDINNQSIVSEKNFSIINSEINLLTHILSLNHAEINLPIEYGFIKHFKENLIKILINACEIQAKLQSYMIETQNKENENSTKDNDSNNIKDILMIDKKKWSNYYNIMSLIIDSMSTIKYLTSKFIEIEISLDNKKQISFKNENCSNLSNHKILSEYQRKIENLDDKEEFESHRLEKIIEDLKQESKISKNLDIENKSKSIFEDLNKFSNEIKKEINDPKCEINIKSTNLEKNIKDILHVDKPKNEFNINNDLSKGLTEIQIIIHSIQKAYHQIKQMRMNDENKYSDEEYSSIKLNDSQTTNLNTQMDLKINQVPNYLSMNLLVCGSDDNFIQQKKEEEENNEKELMNFDLKQHYDKLMRIYSHLMDIIKYKDQEIEDLNTNLQLISIKHKDLQNLCIEYINQIIELQIICKQESNEKQNMKFHLDEITFQLKKSNENTPIKDTQFNKKLNEIKSLEHEYDQLYKKYIDIQTEKEKLSQEYGILQKKIKDDADEIENLQEIIEKLRMDTNNTPCGGINIPSPSLSHITKTELQSPKSEHGNDYLNNVYTNPNLVYQQTKYWTSPNQNKANIGDISSNEAIKVIDYIKDVKKFLDFLYKELIFVITSQEFEAICNSQRDSSTINSGRRTARSSLISFSIPERFIQLEKKVNDTILNIQDYIITLEDKYL